MSIFKIIEITLTGSPSAGLKPGEKGQAKFPMGGIPIKRRKKDKKMKFRKLKEEEISNDFYDYGFEPDEVGLELTSSAKNERDIMVDAYHIGLKIAVARAKGHSKKESELLSSDSYKKYQRSVKSGIIDGKSYITDPEYGLDWLIKQTAYDYK